MTNDTLSDVLLEALALRSGPVPISAYPAVAGGKRPVRNSRPQEFKRALEAQTLLPFAEISRRFSRDQAPNLAVICGPPSSGLAVLDFDEPEAFAAFEAEFPKFVLDSPLVRTRRGYHLGALLDDRAPPLRNGPTSFGDLKTKGGFALWPPSICGGFQRSYVRHPCDCEPKPLTGKVLAWLIEARLPAKLRARSSDAKYLSEEALLRDKALKSLIRNQPTTSPPPSSSMGAPGLACAVIRKSGDPVLVLCARLQLANGGRDFFLSRRMLMQRCGLTAHGARLALATLLDSGELVLVRPGTRGANGRATFYRLQETER